METTVTYKFLVLIFLVLMLQTALSAQEYGMITVPGHEICLGLGVLNYQVKDEIVAPLNWSGPGVAGSLSYSFIGKNGIHELDLGAPFGFISNRYGHQASTFEIKANYAYLRRLRSSRIPGQIYLGSYAGWNQHIQEYKDWDITHLYWLNAFEIGASVCWKHEWASRHDIRLKIRLPLLAMVSRPGIYRYYASKTLPDEIWVKPFQNMQMTSLHQYFSCINTVGYNFRLNQKLSIGAEWKFAFKTCQFPEQITIINHQLSVSFTCKFKSEKTQS